MYGPWDGGWGFGMMLVMLLFLALIIVGVVFVVRSFSEGGRAPSRSGGSRALDILDERFARGEIDREEYAQGGTSWLIGDAWQSARSVSGSRWP
jgi:putative membrane protein